MSPKKKAVSWTTFLVAGSAVVLVSAFGGETTRERQQDLNPVIVELFTSQGCSSCPPADELLSVLRSEQTDDTRVIPLAYHVDYWNHLGWSDPFSSVQWSRRQKAYAQALRSEVYTPQAVVNGGVQLVGSSKEAVRREIAKAGRAGRRGSVSIENARIDGDELVVALRATLERAAGARKPQLVVALFEDGVTTRVTRGENNGRSLMNDSIVRWQRSAFPLSADGRDVSGTLTIPLDAGWRRDRLGAAAFIQDQPSMAIFGAAALRLSAKNGLGNSHVVRRP